MSTASTGATSKIVVGSLPCKSTFSTAWLHTGEKAILLLFKENENKIPTGNCNIVQVDKYSLYWWILLLMNFVCV